MYGYMMMMFSMIYINMQSVNSLSSKLASKEDVERIKTELTQKVEKYLGPFKKEMDEWNQRLETGAKNTNAYG